MFKDLYVAETLHKHYKTELHQVTLQAWKYTQNKPVSQGSFLTSLFRPKQNVCCASCC